MRRFGTVGIVFTTLLVTGVAAAEPATANPPDVQTVIVDESFKVGGFCKFPIVVTLDGKLQVVSHVDRNEDVIFEIGAVNELDTIVNPKNGKFVQTRDVGLDKVVFEQDGTAYVLSTGIHVAFITSGGGLVFAAIGLQIINLDEQGNVVSTDIIGGRFDTDTTFHDFICASLS